MLSFTLGAFGEASHCTTKTSLLLFRSSGWETLIQWTSEIHAIVRNSKAPASSPLLQTRLFPNAAAFHYAFVWETMCSAGAFSAS